MSDEKRTVLQLREQAEAARRLFFRNQLDEVVFRILLGLPPKDAPTKEETKR